MAFKIKSKEQITQFFGTLGNEGIAFHPDKDFDAYLVKETGAKRYTRTEVELRNLILKSCFDYCQVQGLDIYELYREVYKVDIEARLRKYLPVLFEILEGRTLDWKAINKKFEKVFRKRAKDQESGKKLVEVNLYDVISESLSGNKQAERLIRFLQKLLEEINVNLGVDKAKINDTLYGMLIEFDLNYYNYVAELAVLNQLLKSNDYSLIETESPLGNGNSAEFLLNKKDGNVRILLEVVSIRPRIFPGSDDEIVALIDQKVREKIGKKTKGDPKYFIFLLVPVFWGSAAELKKVASLIHEGKIRAKDNILELCGYCTFSDEGNNYLDHRFGTLATLFPYSAI
jgi:hypothetical protein